MGTAFGHGARSVIVTVFLIAGASAPLIVGSSLAQTAPCTLSVAIQAPVGAVSVGTTLTASAISSAACGPLTYQWFQDRTSPNATPLGNYITFATLPSYTVTPADSGAQLLVRVTTTSSGTTTAANSPGVTIAGSAPVLGDGPSTVIDNAAYSADVPVAINPVNGNAIVTEDDFDLPNTTDHTFSRTLNTLQDTGGDIGAGWRENWGDVTLTEPSTNSWTFTDPSGYRETFSTTAPATDPGYYYFNPNTGEVDIPAGDEYYFDKEGRFAEYWCAYETDTASYISVTPMLQGITSGPTTLAGVGYILIGTGTKAISSVTSASTTEVTYGYDAYGLLRTVTNVFMGQNTTLYYTSKPWAQPREIDLSDGHVTKFSYDNLGRIKSVEQIDPSSSADVTTSVAYSAPTDPSCTAADVGETTITGGQDAEDQVYCYNALGQVTNAVYQGD